MEGGRTGGSDAVAIEIVVSSKGEREEEAEGEGIAEGEQGSI